ncbi:uncharacterized protein RB166_016000 [Leptodactylus fuscus]
MDSGRNLVGILFCLVCGLSCGDVGWPLLNMDLMDEDIRKEVDQALQVVNQPNFQGWRMELIKQAVPRMHIGLVELWLLFRKLQKEQDEMQRKMKRMMRMAAASSQELKAKIVDFTLQVPERMDVIEKRLEMVNMRVKTIEDAQDGGSYKMEGHLDKNKTSFENLPKEACNRPCADRRMGPGRGKVSTNQLAHKVAALTELLNGHNELLVELYERMTALEEVNGARHASHTPRDGSGDGR